MDKKQVSLLSGAFTKGHPKIGGSWNDQQEIRISLSLKATDWRSQVTAHGYFLFLEWYWESDGDFLKYMITGDET